MSTNCIRCGVMKRTGLDLLCDGCRSTLSDLRASLELLRDAAQFLDACPRDETWTEWDQQLRDRIAAFNIDLMRRGVIDATPDFCQGVHRVVNGVCENCGQAFPAAATRDDEKAGPR